MKLLLFFLMVLAIGCSFLIPKEGNPIPKENPIVAPSEPPPPQEIIDQEERLRNEATNDAAGLTTDVETETDETETGDEAPQEKATVSVKEVCINGLIHYYTSRCTLFPKFKLDGSLWPCN